MTECQEPEVDGVRCQFVSGYCLQCGKPGKPADLAVRQASVMPSAAYALVCPVCEESRTSGRHCPNCRYDYQAGLPFDANAYVLDLQEHVLDIGNPVVETRTHPDVIVQVLTEETAGVLEESYRHRLSLGSVGGGVLTVEVGRGAVTQSQGDYRLLIADPGVSRSHCAITLGEDGLECRDCGSTNGTVLNGRRLEKDMPARFKPQATLLIGQHTILRFLLEDNTP